MGMRRGICRCGGIDAMTMVGVMVILARYNPRRRVARDQGKGESGDGFWGSFLRTLVGHLGPLDFFERVS